MSDERWSIIAAMRHIDGHARIYSDLHTHGPGAPAIPLPIFRARPSLRW